MVRRSKCLVGLAAALVAIVPNAVTGDASASTPDAASGPSFSCTLNANGDISGAYGTASAMGWEGNHQAVVACLGGSFVVQNGREETLRFGIYQGARTHWKNAAGYLPALITIFGHDGAAVTITEFCDRVVLSSHPFVLLYARVAINNPSAKAVAADPDPTRGLTSLNSSSDTVPPRSKVVHDYVIAVDRFGNRYPWPTARAMAGAGGFRSHFAHMAAYWNAQLATIAHIAVPDQRLADAYRAGFVYTQIARSGNQLNTGVNGYAAEYSHDVIGILANFFTQGYFRNAPGLLDEARSVVGASGSPNWYVDGLWLYPWPWAIYLLKTGDLARVRANFSTPGPGGSAQPSIMDAAHAIATDRTGPGGIMQLTNDIDTNGYWTVDDNEALLGLAAYRYLAQRVGATTEVAWATNEYNSLLTAVNKGLGATISRYGLDYLPCSIFQPNTFNRCSDPEDANWASPLALWAWNASLFGGREYGPIVDLIDATYAYGLGRLRGVLPPNTFGGYPGAFYSNGYNAGYGAAGLSGQRYRSQGIASYEFMINDTQSGPNSWWESVSPPTAADPWVGSHPASGQGSSPHAWGMSQNNKALLDSLAVQRSDGVLVVGRGIPGSWLKRGDTTSVRNFPVADGHRIALRITSSGTAVHLTMGGPDAPSGNVILEMPGLVSNIAGVSTGRADEGAGSVEIPPSVKSLTVRLRHPAAG